MSPKQMGTIFLLVLGIGFTATANGQALGYSVAAGQLVELDLETGSFSTIGPVGAFEIAGLAVGADGLLYGVSDFTDELWQIDPATGNGTLIGPLGVDVLVDSGLTFDACGTLWMFTDRRLYQVDPGTGAAALASDFGEEIMALTARGTALLALVTVGAGTQLATVDPVAGTLSLFGDLVFLPTFQQGLDFDDQGRLWGIFWMDGPIPGPWVSSIVRYDPLTGQVLSTRELGIAQVQPVIGGNLAISPPRGTCIAFPLEIPTSSSSSLLALALLLGVFGLLLMRRS